MNANQSFAILQEYDSLRVVSWILGTSGFIANVSVIMWMIYSMYNPLKRFHRKNIRNISNNPSLLIIFNLAVADLLGALYLIILAVSDKIHRASNGTPNENGTYENTWIVSPTCFAGRILSQIWLLMSIFITVLITVSRFIPVVYPYSTSEITVKKARIALISFWIISIAIAICGATESLTLAYTKLNHYSILGHLCQLESPDTPLLRAIVYGELVFGVVAYFGTIILYIIIACKLRKSRAITTSITSRRNSAESKVHLIIAWIVLTNVISWIPITTMTILEGFIDHFISEQYYISPLLVLLLFLNNVINPVVYLIIGTYAILKRQRQVTTMVQQLSQRTSERRNNGE